MNKIEVSQSVQTMNSGLENKSTLANIYNQLVLMYCDQSKSNACEIIVLDIKVSQLGAKLP